ncbi:Ktr system potassium transporter B, partial [Vibrio sp. 10N.222.49.F1]
MNSVKRRGTFYTLKSDKKPRKGSEPKIILTSFLGVLIPSAILLTLPVF